MEYGRLAKAIRGSFLDIAKSVENVEDIPSNIRYIEDGLMLIKDGKIDWIGEWEEGRKYVPDNIRVRDYQGKIIVPGFIDTHVHYPHSLYRPET